MKRTLVAFAALAAVSGAAFQPPAHAPLPNFDRRTDRAPVVDVVAPEHAAAVDSLKARVPQLEVTTSDILKSPNFFLSRAGFLTGPNAQGLAVSPETAQAIAPNDPHRPIKA